MMPAVADRGSFRDPGGRVFLSGDRILRAVMESAMPACEAARKSGLYAELAELGLLLPARPVSIDEVAATAPQTRQVLEHPRVPYLSYPYEWSFSLHKRAALLQLDLHLAALERGFTLSDASAYNVQFFGTQPIFIDHLSLRPYREGEIWEGHRQFCAQYLNPLLMWTKLGVAPNAWFRGSLEGIPPEDLAPLLPLKHKLSWTVLSHVTAQAALQRRAARATNGASKRLSEARLPPSALRGMLEGLRHFISGLSLARQKTVWADYAADNSYEAAEAEAKRGFVTDMVSTVKPTLMFDIGCNSGDYSDVALSAGARYVVGFDFDTGALEQATARFGDRRDFLPLWLDAANPSPVQGWAEAERKGFLERAERTDALVALAVVHHLAISRNVPLEMVVEWLVGLAPTGIIEFVPKSDPMVQRLLALRDDIFPDYTTEAFLAHVSARAQIVKVRHQLDGSRVLLWYDRRAGA
jgi:ribosomal protein L11 methylase PrmA